MILPQTARATGGTCMPCHQKMTSPPPLPTPARLPRQLAFPDGLDIETAVREFLELGRSIQAGNQITGRIALAKVLTWYRDTRIVGADFGEDGDMLLLQSGSTQPLELSEPKDLRNTTDSELSFAQQSCRYVDFTRQVCASGVDEEVEFDDAAVKMSITLGFEPADGSEASSSFWICSPDEIDGAIREFMTPYVSALIERPVKSLAIFVSRCG